MINVEKANREFAKYIETFDKSNVRINGKEKHSIRVQNFSKEIAEDIGLNQEKVELAMVIGLLHDIGRFEQEKQFHTFYDFESMDHGDYGADILKDRLSNFIDTSEYNNIIIASVKNHNKLAIDENLNNEEMAFAKIVRDADKLDIMEESINFFFKNKEELVNNSKISDYSFDFVKKNQSVVLTSEFKPDYADHIVRVVAFVFDVNYKKSFEIIKKNDYINRIIDRYDFKDEKTKIRIEEIRKIANEYVENNL